MQVEFFLVQNQWNTPSYKRCGCAIYGREQMETTIWDVIDNPLSNQQIDGGLVFTSGLWYGLFIGVDQNGNFRLAAWECDNPQRYLWHDFAGGSAWAQGQWAFNTQVDEGVVQFDDIYFLAFDPFSGTASPAATCTPTQAASAGGPTVSVSMDPNWSPRFFLLDALPLSP
jgi:hypothetical protein